MNQDLDTVQNTNVSLQQSTIRLRVDQKDRLESEVRARGGNLAEALRDNLDLAFAMKEELSKIVECEFDQHDPKNVPRLVHSLLFRVEERILNALDGLSRNMDGKLASLSGLASVNSPRLECHKDLPSADKAIFGVDGRELAEAFVSLVVEDSRYPTTVWLGAFLEIVPRLESVSQEQIKELEYKGEDWLEGQ